MIIKGPFFITCLIIMLGSGLEFPSQWPIYDKISNLINQIIWRIFLQWNYVEFVIF